MSEIKVLGCTSHDSVGISYNHGWRYRAINVSIRYADHTIAGVSQLSSNGIALFRYIANQSLRFDEAHDNGVFVHNNGRRCDTVWDDESNMAVVYHRYIQI